MHRPSLTEHFIELPGDEALIRQALLNLDAERRGSRRERGTACRKSRFHGTVRRSLGGRKWQRICVADNGPGIPDQRSVENFPAVLYNEIRRALASALPWCRKSRCSTAAPSKRAIARRRGRIPSLVTFATGAFTLSIPLRSRPHLNS